MDNRHALLMLIESRISHTTHIVKRPRIVLLCKAAMSSRDTYTGTRRKILIVIKNDGGPDFFPRLLEGTFRLIRA